MTRQTRDGYGNTLVNLRDSSGNEIGSFVGPEAYPLQGQVLTIDSAAAETTSAITGSYVDVHNALTIGVYVHISDGTVAVANGTDYFMPAGTTFTFPISSGNTVSVIRSEAGTGDVYVHPVG